MAGAYSGIVPEVVLEGTASCAPAPVHIAAPDYAPKPRHAPRPFYKPVYKPVPAPVYKPAPEYKPAPVFKPDSIQLTHLLFCRAFKHKEEL